jgi:hypothetical protein
VVINEVQYNGAPNQPNSAFVELFNRSSAQTPFDLSGFELRGVNYNLPRGIIYRARRLHVAQPPTGWVRRGLRRHDTSIRYVPGGLDNQGEKLTCSAQLTPHSRKHTSATFILAALCRSPPPQPALDPHSNAVDGTQDGFARRIGHGSHEMTLIAHPAKPTPWPNPPRFFEPLWINEINRSNVTIFAIAREKRVRAELYNSKASLPSDTLRAVSNDYLHNLPSVSNPAVPP